MKPSAVAAAVAPFLPQGLWRDWTPVITQSGAVTVTVIWARYTVIGKTAHVMMAVQATGAGTGGQPINISGWPAGINPRYSSLATPHGAGSVYDSSGTTLYVGNVSAASYDDHTSVRIRAHNTTAEIGTSPSFALASGDVVAMTVTWEIL